MQATLLIELLTEELPPKALPRLSQAFCDALMADLKRGGFLSAASVATPYATPRRLALAITEVLAKAADQPLEMTGPSVKIGLDAAGKPTQALASFAKKRGVTVDSLVQ